MSRPLGGPATAPVTESSLRQLDRRARRLLGLLLEPVKREQDATTCALLGEQDPVDNAIAIDSDLPDVSLEVASGDQTAVADVGHAGEYRCGIAIGQRIDEFFNRTAARGRPVVAPSPTRGRTILGR